VPAVRLGCQPKRRCAALQGESDAGIFDEAPGYRVYGRLLAALLASWRQRLQQPALPFVIVQVL
jgi:hypothetical protein